MVVGCTNLRVISYLWLYEVGSYLQVDDALHLLMQVSERYLGQRLTNLVERL
jgi:hypothetical protein